MEYNIKFDPATNETLQEFMNIFVPDPCIRMDLEELFSVAARNSTCVNPDDVAKLKIFAAAYNDAENQAVRNLIKYAANAAVVQIIHAFRESQGRAS